MPGQPINVRGEALSSRVINVTWEAPENPGDMIESYEVYYNDSQFKQNVHVTIAPPRTSFRMSDLSPNTLYLVKVSAKSSRGEGAPSSTLAIATLEDGQFSTLGSIFITLVEMKLFEISSETENLVPLA